MGGAAEMLAYGTAVTVEDVADDTNASPSGENPASG
jgi:hypothetical protein